MLSSVEISTDSFFIFSHFIFCQEIPLCLPRYFSHFKDREILHNVFYRQSVDNTALQHPVAHRAFRHEAGYAR